jgi:hypothetical protein
MVVENFELLEEYKLSMLLKAALQVEEVYLIEPKKQSSPFGAHLSWTGARNLLPSVVDLFELLLLDILSTPRMHHRQ